MMLKKKASVYMFAIILLMLVSLSLAHASSQKIMSAQTINVPNDYPTIQAAVNAAIAGDTILVDSGTYYENVVVNKFLTLKGAGSAITIIDGSGRGTGVKITTDNVTISGFTIRNSLDGVHLYICNGVTVSDNTIILNKNDGVWIEASSNNVIGDNTITLNNIGGILLGHSSGNAISGNAISNNDYGIYLYGGSNDNTVNGNIITLHINGTGISLDASNSNAVNHNTIWSNRVGIDISEARDNTIVGNTISNSSYYGGDLFYSSDNVFYHNNFIDNADQVAVNGINIWNNSLGEGNFWSNYNGTDADGDGIGDTPYEIYATNQDGYPLMNPYDETSPVADAGPDQLVVNGTTVTFDGNGSTDNLNIVNYGIVNYTWSFTDNTTTILTGLKVNYTFHNAGDFSVTLNVSDYSANWDTDEMWVNVTVTQVARDVAITSITAFPTTVITGEPLFIDVTVANEGDMNETFSVTVYYGSSVVGTKGVTSLASGTNEMLSLNWDTTGAPGGDYIIKAVANIVPGETNTTDNTRTYGTVTIEKLVSTISVFAFPANITVGESVTINGSISPVRVEVNVTIHYRLSGEAWSTLTTVTTGADGRYSYDWTPTMAGTYEVKAGWEGDDTTLAGESDVGAVTVKESATNIYLYAAMAMAVVIVVSVTVVHVVRVRKPKST